jgi:hypothetical protein
MTYDYCNFVIFWRIFQIIKQQEFSVETFSAGGEKNILRRLEREHEGWLRDSQKFHDFLANK